MIRFSLSSLLFVNNLLAEDHFFSWLLNNLESCAQQALPLWLALTSQYAKSIMQDCLSRQRFAQVLFARTAEVSGLSPSTKESVTDYMTSFWGESITGLLQIVDDD